MFPSRTEATYSKTFLIAFSFSFTNSSGSSSNWHLTSVEKIKSYGSLGNHPYAIWNSDTSVVSCTATFKANANGFSSLLDCLDEASQHYLECSVETLRVPSYCGWCGEVSDLSMSSDASSSLYNSAFKHYPRSVSLAHRLNTCWCFTPPQCNSSANKTFLGTYQAICRLPNVRPSASHGSTRRLSSSYSSSYWND